MDRRDASFPDDPATGAGTSVFGAPLRTRDWFFLLALIAAVFAAYQPAWRAGFIWNDAAQLTPPELRSASGLVRIWSGLDAAGQYHPVAQTVFWIGHQAFGENPAGYHLLNIGLHALCAVFLWRVLRRWQVPGAHLAAGIFALHPVMVDSVAWITQLRNTLAVVLGLAAVLVYQRYEERRGRGWYALALVRFVLALLCAPIVALLPVALLAAVWWRRGRLSWLRDVRPLLPFFVLGAGAVAAAAGTAGKFAAGGIERGLIAAHALWFYLGKILWPEPLLPIYPRWLVSRDELWPYMYLVALLTGLVALWLGRRSVRGILAATICFIALLFPVLGFFNVTIFVHSFVADHLQYLASIAVIVVVAAGIAGLQPWIGRAGVTGLSLILLAGLGLLSWRQNWFYRDAETLYRRTVAQNSEAWLAQGELGRLLVKAGRYEEAMEYLTTAQELQPDNPDVQYSLGLVYLHLRRPDQAVVLFEEVLQARPGDLDARTHLGDTLLLMQQFPSAIAAYQAALQLKPDLPVVENNLGAALLQAGQAREAIPHFEAALRLDPNFARARAGLEAAQRAAAENPRS